jgi:hypothetical protein
MTTNPNNQQSIDLCWLDYYCIFSWLICSSYTREQAIPLILKGIFSLRRRNKNKGLVAIHRTKIST